MANNYIYFVEGQNEKKLVDVLKSEFQWIANGKVFVHNVLTRPIPRASLRQIKNNTIAIFLFDTDNEQCGIDLLQENIQTLKSQHHIKDVITILQVKNIEDELIRSTDIRKITDLLQSKSENGFKNDFNRTDMRRLRQKLEEHHFDIDRLWVMKGTGIFAEVMNNSAKIRVKH